MNLGVINNVKKGINFYRKIIDKEYRKLVKEIYAVNILNKL